MISKASATRQPAVRPRGASWFRPCPARWPDALLPAALAHLAVNLLTVPVAHGLVSPSARGVAVAVLLAGFAWTALGASTDDPVAGARQVSMIA